eukprot:TRINITY_DN81891_c0_g1_i1.p1 TRINITY_DN81891_c0_g1~~TRINITY_DN81891_c0_g1_i1.p1  ORF type:complete len:198 (-),score=76.09 TRINITY_DN81891_c0_g1_i1:62-655(-)
MLGGNYDDSESEGGGVAKSSDEEEGEKPPAPTGTGGEAEEAEEEDDEDDEEEDEDAASKLTSAAKAFKTLDALGQEGLGFKKFEKDQAKNRKVRAHAMSLDRVTAASAASLRGQGWSPSADAKDAQLPPAAAEGDAGSKRPAEANEGGGGGKGKDGKGKMSVKELTRLKRFKGQSGIDHNGKTWKPEIWMQMRQQFD